MAGLLVPCYVMFDYVPRRSALFQRQTGKEWVQRRREVQKEEGGVEGEEIIV